MMVQKTAQWEASNLETISIYPLKNWCKVFYRNSWILPLPSSHNFCLSRQCRFLHIYSAPHLHRTAVLSLPWFEVRPYRKSSATYFSHHTHRFQGEPWGHREKGCREGFDTEARGRCCSHRSAALCPAGLICVGRRSERKRKKQRNKTRPWLNIKRWGFLEG